MTLDDMYAPAAQYPWLKRVRAACIRLQGKVLSSAMKRLGTVTTVGFAMVILAGCGASDEERRAAQASSVMAEIAADTSWVPTGMDHMNDVAWKWTDKSQYECKSFQDTCWGVTVTPRWACPDGVYVEISVSDGGVVVGKANEITGAVEARQSARAVLSPPGGAPEGARAKVATLNCLG